MEQSQNVIRQVGKIPKLSDPDMQHQSLAAARESWWMFNIIAEMVTASERLAGVSPAVAIFGSTPERGPPLLRDHRNDRA